eukprot:TRINITY_DN51_c0_g1_i5.p1 TRINITY_DN51_c0_g1~~TRINITY_DN51_c0_g1_i5.p1  ORF type:complete len:149 (+),score=32.82 TRINITY_DN51_c0_g1_i5:28-474(+)
MREPPQNQASSMKRATCQGHWFSCASCPPTILPSACSAAGGPSIPQVALRSMLVPFLVEKLFLASLAALVIMIMCSSQVISWLVWGNHGMSWLVLAHVTSLGWPPVLLRPEPAAFWEGQSHCCAKKSSNENLHLVGFKNKFESPCTLR